LITIMAELVQNGGYSRAQLRFQLDPSRLPDRAWVRMIIHGRVATGMRAHAAT
jgi:hypothetical protein